MGETRLEYIQLYPTVRCNKSCSFCFNHAIKPCDDLGHSSYLRLLEKLIKHGLRYVDVMGGEPFLNRELFKIVQSTLEAGLCINISTNGILKKSIKGFLSSFDDRVTLGISINSIADLEHSKDLIKTHKAVTKSVYAKKTGFYELTKQILMLRPRRHYIIYPDILGNMDGDYSIPFFEFYSTWNELFSKEAIEPVFCSGFLPDEGTESLRCPAGTKKIGILPDGSVYPCNLFFGIKEFYLGNIFTEGLKKILSSPVLDYFREFTSSPCKNTDCFLYNRCHGGCPVHGLVHYGSLNAPDPRCYKIKKYI